MRIARFWRRQTATALDARGREHCASAWGWSQANPADAEANAKEAAERTASLLAAGKLPRGRRRDVEYEYLGGRPPREEILQEFHDAAGETFAFISRNSYGALVLNARDLIIVDADFQPPPGVAQRLIAKFSGRKPESANSQEAVLARIRAWCAQHRELAVRIYRTFAGFRVIITNLNLPADNDEVRQILQELGSDPLYRRLCESQQSFRARLTPKPWRINNSSPPTRYPFANEEQEQAYREWQEFYEQVSRRCACCRFVEAHGPREVSPESAPLMELHDSLSRANTDLPLA
jgi:hypothetical protein